MKNLIKVCLIVFIFTSFTTTSKPTLKEVYNEIVRQEIKEPEIVLRQVIQETGWLKCTKCSLDKNNLFGFTYRKYIDGKKHTYYQRYSNWKESIAAYKKWQDRS